MGGRGDLEGGYVELRKEADVWMWGCGDVGMAIRGIGYEPGGAIQGAGGVTCEKWCEDVAKFRT